MSQTLQEENKALVLEAFDTLFNKRDYAAAERSMVTKTWGSCPMSSRGYLKAPF